MTERSNKKKYPLCAAALALAVLLAGCAPAEGAAAATAQPTAEPTEAPTPTPEPEANPLTGEQGDYTNQRPVAVSIRTGDGSTPQWGIAAADVLIEGVTEGKTAGLTAVFASVDSVEKAGPERFGDGYYDRFNTAVGLDSAGRMQLHHKGRLVIGVENTPTWVFDAMKFLVIDLGGTVGQIGKGLHGTAFEHNGVKTGPAICYEGLYGDFYGGFVRRGAQFMAIISNDGWWGDTPGYKHLFSISRLRAVEHRRAIARSANTGKSGFISARGDVGQTLGWEQRGVITAEVPLNSELTFYTRYGDCLARISEYILLLSVLYYVAYRYKRRNHLVK